MFCHSWLNDFIYIYMYVYIYKSFHFLRICTLRMGSYYNSEELPCMTTYIVLPRIMYMVHALLPFRSWHWPMCVCIPFRFTTRTFNAWLHWSQWSSRGEYHDDVIKWKHFPRYWPFVRGIHRSPVNSPHKGQWRGALMFTLICVWINGIFWIGIFLSWSTFFQVMVWSWLGSKPLQEPNSNILWISMISRIISIKCKIRQCTYLLAILHNNISFVTCKSHPYIIGFRVETGGPVRSSVNAYMVNHTNDYRHVAWDGQIECGDDTHSDNK